MKQEKPKKKKKHYWFKFWRWVATIVYGKHKTIWAEPFNNEPCVFVCNHERAYGPIAMLGMFPLRDEVNPWIVSDVCHVKTMPAYIRQDFWWKPNKWYSKILDYTITYPIALILPSLLRGCEPIEVHHDANVFATFKASLQVLENNRHIVLFPEQPLGFGEYDQSLDKGFVNIARLYVKKSHKSLNFYPVYIDQKTKTFDIGKPVVVSTFDKDELQNLAISEKLGTALVELKSKYNQKSDEKQ